jgi:hypothetical protein
VGKAVDYHGYDLDAQLKFETVLIRIKLQQIYNQLVVWLFGCVDGTLKECLSYQPVQILFLVE